jgi:hypothetical protein
MILCVLASLLIPEGNIRNVTACAGIGLPMWITAVAILSQDKKQSALEEATRVLGTAS